MHSVITFPPGLAPPTQPTFAVASHLDSVILLFHEHGPGRIDSYTLARNMVPRGYESLYDEYFTAFLTYHFVYETPQKMHENELMFFWHQHKMYFNPAAYFKTSKVICQMVARHLVRCSYCGDGAHDIISCTKRQADVKRDIIMTERPKNQHVTPLVLLKRDIRWYQQEIIKRRYHFSKEATHKVTKECRMKDAVFHKLQQELRRELNIPHLSYRVELTAAGPPAAPYPPPASSHQTSGAPKPVPDLLSFVSVRDIPLPPSPPPLTDLHRVTIGGPQVPAVQFQPAPPGDDGYVSSSTDSADMEVSEILKNPVRSLY